MAVYFLYGEEDFNIDIELEKMRSKLNPDFLSMSYQVLESPDFSTLINAVRTTPMMFGSTLTVVNATNYFFDKKKTWFEDSELEELEEALPMVGEAVDIVFVVNVPRNENKKIDTRRKLFKILSKFNPTEFKTYSTLYPKEIETWVKNRAKSKGLTLKDDAAELMVQQIGNDLRLFDKELEKLILVVYPEKVVTKEVVEKNCISNQDIFNITKSIMHNQKDKALLEYKKLLDVKYPLEILSAIQTMLRQWIIVKSAFSNQDIVKMTGINEKRIGYMKKDLQGIALKDLIKLKTNLYEVECRIKSGQALDAESEVECALIR